MRPVSLGTYRSALLCQPRPRSVLTHAEASRAGDQHRCRYGCFAGVGGWRLASHAEGDRARANSRRALRPRPGHPRGKGRRHIAARTFTARSGQATPPLATTGCPVSCEAGSRSVGAPPRTDAGGYGLPRRAHSPWPLERGRHACLVEGGRPWYGCSQTDDTHLGLAG
ncbi:uncharacterized protein SCHCODRAFT_02270301 [Schizophyllum commune H4-8]|uniref:Expressed protein n=1 Tax=Schizophyllum commune (strain H4-8 / FGSC 9210) TaxID=578458 RepID=D8PKG3_SCHCM|nr:uncharacterized protein SCHCODRAFT_02270301 [Schizophyllum commune H4-8]KAI5894144.1 hypothetical protein SCHCODRAFT_02270301 [Schizophyllum commune H4-8]